MNEERIVRDAQLVLSSKFLQTLMAYHITLFIIFVLIYRYAIDFKKHFRVEEGTPANISLISYFTLLSQTTVMTEIAPKTSLGRSLLATHIFFSWFIVVLSMTPIGENIAGFGFNSNY
jgi:hypothetical protein